MANERERRVQLVELIKSELEASVAADRQDAPDQALAHAENAGLYVAEYKSRLRRAAAAAAPFRLEA